MQQAESGGAFGTYNQKNNQENYDPNNDRENEKGEIHGESKVVEMSHALQERWVQNV